MTHNSPQPDPGNPIFPHAQSQDIEERAMLADALFKIDIDALRIRAMALRDGIPCAIYDTLELALKAEVRASCMTFYFDIKFADGVVWMAVLRRCVIDVDGRMDRNELEAVGRVEVGTMETMRKRGIPVPAVFDFDVSDMNAIHAAFVLMDRPLGKVLDWPRTNVKRKQRVISQLADVYAEISRYPCSKFGVTATTTTATYELADALFHPSIEETNRVKQPAYDPQYAHFVDVETYHKQTLTDKLHEIATGADHYDRPIDSFLLYTYLLLNSGHSSYPFLDDGYFYLFHRHETGNHIFVDDNGNITGIVDWGWTMTDSKSAAFSAPEFLVPETSLRVGNGLVGSEEIELARCLGEMDRKDLTEIVMRGRVLQYFRFLLHRIDVFDDWDLFCGIFRGFACYCEGNDGPEMGWEFIRERLLELIHEGRLDKLVTSIPGLGHLAEVACKSYQRGEVSG